MGTSRPISVVVPLFNEEDNVAPLVEAVERALAGWPSWELLLVDDGSEDGTAARAARLAATRPQVSLIRLARNYGQATAVQAGFDHACGEVVVTMDGDLQNDPADIELLLEKLNEGFDLVSGYRLARQDKFLTRKVPSWAANRLIGLATGIPIRDFGCGIKAYRRHLLGEIALYADMHRFTPIVAAAAAHARIAEIPVRHHPRVHGTSKYGLSRIWKVLGDILTVVMIRWFRSRPLMMFALGSLGALAVAAAFAASAWASADFVERDLIAPVVLPGAAMLGFGLAVYLLMLGLIAEFAAYGLRRNGNGSTGSL